MQALLFFLKAEGEADAHGVGGGEVGVLPETLPLTLPLCVRHGSRQAEKDRSNGDDGDDDRVDGDGAQDSSVCLSVFPLAVSFFHIEYK